jgi:peptidoglycan hydrolase-like protein with peptidoglycan-binding domain/3D (Asp-Asp-Asp) domain-containing protein
VRGGYEADKVLNGEGVRTADETDVHAGVAAAPTSYPFGTVVSLPGIGNFTVRDRGGAIRELEGGIHRLDLWVGEGEEGLARALAFGVQRVHGTVYPAGGTQPSESFALETLPVAIDRLEAYEVSGGNLLAVHPKIGDRSLSVEMLQESLRDAGYFAHGVTGFFGATTQESLHAFNEAYWLSSEPADRLSDRSAATLVAAVRRAGAVSPVEEVSAWSAASAVRAAQRTLRFFGLYRGRTSGEYDATLVAAILKFQQMKNLVGTADDPGAGRIGPLTKASMTAAWNRRIVTAIAERLLVLHRMEGILGQRGRSIDRFLAEGDSGDQVMLLQRLLADRGYFPPEEINGHFGPLTKSAVTAYQMEEGIIADASEEGAGSIGPQTLQSLRSSEQLALYRLVRSEGWDVL